MRFLIPFLALSAVVGVIARPVSRQEDSVDIITQATENTEAFNDNLRRIIGLISEYRIPIELQSTGAIMSTAGSS
jgi:hypothetical protein